MSHQHHHDHHGHNHGNAAQANRDHFDKHASEYETALNGLGQKLTTKVVEQIVKDVPLNKESTSILDFACGTGLVSRSLAEYVDHIVGVDISQSMVDEYTKNAEKAGLSGKLRAVREELKGNGTELDGAKFDVITCSMAYHHFDDPTGMTKILSTFLKPGGYIVIADHEKITEGTIVQGDIADIGQEAVPHSQGFSREEFVTMVGNAALEFKSYEHAASLDGAAIGLKKSMEIFLGTAIKPLEIL